MALQTLSGGGAGREPLARRWHAAGGLSSMSAWVVWPRSRRRGHVAGFRACLAERQVEAQIVEVGCIGPC